MKTILHISKYYPPDMGGIETVARYLCEGCTDYRNAVVCFATDGSTRHDEVNGIPVWRVKPLLRLSSQDIALSYYHELKKAVRTFRPDLVIVHCPNPFVYPLVRRAVPRQTKIALLWHSDILAKGMLYRLIRGVEGRMLRRADCIITTSPAYIHSSSPVWKHREKVSVLPNAIITDEFILRPGDAEEIDNLRNAYDNRPIILFVGRHIPYKGIDHLLRAEPLIRSDCRIIIAGSGPETERLRAKTRSPRVSFIGRISGATLRRLYHAAAIFAFPSLTKQEAFGVALAEAMYCRCVPVTYHLDGSGVNWVSPGGITGEEVALGDIEAYAKAVDRVLTDDALRQRYADEAHRRIADNFTSEKVVGQAQELWQRIIGGDEANGQ